MNRIINNHNYKKTFNRCYNNNNLYSFFKQSLTTTNSSYATSSSTSFSSLTNNINKSTTEKKKEQWKKLIFTDLHVSSKTLDRTLMVLKSIREQSLKHSIEDVVFLGDFWHHRNILQVKHIDRLLEEFEQWQKSNINAIFIPGNHDQVSVDGTVHGIQFLGLFDNIKLATEPIYDHSNLIAYLPWREQKDNQSNLFTTLLNNNNDNNNDKWTVFAHAEVKGATSNNGHKASGKVDNNQLSGLRACYLGHYHQRQKLYDNTWYIGSPYQQNFGEMNQPHGIAIVSNSQIEPQFIDLDDLPQHHRLYYPVDFDVSNHKKIRENDIVEVRATKDMMKQQHFIDSLNNLPILTELRRVMISPDSLLQQQTNQQQQQVEQSNTTNDKSLLEIKRKKKPTTSFKLEDFLIEYVEKMILESSKREDLIRVGKDLLAQIKETSITPIGRNVKISKMDISNFASVTGDFSLDFKPGMYMIRGKMGAGKSSIFEALVWALYGSTSPRKQSTASAAIRGDEVINDSAKQTKVTVHLEVDGRPISITRSKKRNQGSKVEITGLDQYRQRIDDQQATIHNIVGLDYDLFRMCVYLGQGSVSNFATDTDRRRKELLTKAFSLGVCIPAAKLAKEQRKKHEAKVDDLIRKREKMAASLATWEEIDYQDEIEQWNQSRLERANQLSFTLDEKQQHLEKLKIDNSFNDSESLKESLEQSRIDLQNELKQLEYDLKEYMENYQTNLVNVNTNHHKIQFSIDRNREEMKKINHRLKKLLQHTTNHHNHKSNEQLQCEECGQDIDKHIQETQRNECNSKLNQLETEVQQMEIELSNVDREKSKLQADKSNNNQLFNYQKHRLEDQIKEINLKLNNSIIFQMQYLEKEIKDLKYQIDQLEKDQQNNSHNNPFTSQEKIRETNIKKLKQDIAKIDSQLEETEVPQLETLKFWEEGFGTDGLSTIALNHVISEIEDYANEYLSILSDGRLFSNLSLVDDDLTIDVMELVESPSSTGNTKQLQKRSYYQLSGGQRRCVELAYSPFALSEVIFNHVGSRVSLLVIDELSNHLDVQVKPIICDLLRSLKERDSIVVIDHDQSVQSEFDSILILEKDIVTQQHKLSEI